MQYLGVPYVWGGASPSGFDCSGLASYAYAQIGKSVPHFTGAIWAAFPQVPSDQLQPGDLVFFNGLGHMGIYIGGGQYGARAPHRGRRPRRQPRRPQRLRRRGPALVQTAGGSAPPPWMNREGDRRSGS